MYFIKIIYGISLILNIYQNRIKNGKPQSRRKIVNGIETGLTYVEQESRKIQQDGKSKEKSVNMVLKNSLENMVLKKFHTLFKRQIPEPFYIVTDTHLVLQDNLLNLFTDKQNSVMDSEVLSRWDLLEFGFGNLQNAESIEIDENLEFVIQKKQRSVIWEGSEEFDPSKDEFFKQMIHISNDTFWERKFEKIS